MDMTIKIFKSSICAFFQNSQYFIITVTFLFLPWSISVLLSQAIETSSFPLLSTIRYRIESLFDAAGFPPFSKFFIFLNLKLSQTISSTIFTLPFRLSFFLVAKAAIIQTLSHKKSISRSPLPSLLSLYNPLLLTYLCSSVVIFSVHIISLSILFLLFNTFNALGYNSQDLHFFLSAVGAVLYSIVLSQTLLTCNLALVVAGIENCNGFLAISEAHLLIRGRSSTALFLALPVNLGLAFLEALFQYRVVRRYHAFSYSIDFEGILIAYLYSLLVLYDTIVTCIFYKSGLEIEREQIQLLQDHGAC